MRARLRWLRRGGAVRAAAAVLVCGGGAALGVGLASQVHAPQPAATQAGSTGPLPASGHPATARSRPGGREGLEALAAALARVDLRAASGGRELERSRPVALSIPAIDLSAPVGEVGLNADGTIEVPPLFAEPSEAAWYRLSPTPGQLGPSVIVGHVDNVDGPAVFFRLGALSPGERIEVDLADGAVATFAVDGVRRYEKARFPTTAVYGPTGFAALRLVTCGGPFDAATRQYLDNVVVFASLVSSSEADR